jgi:phosphoglycolate phosphatase-like HAD superfamily hydrolase
MLQGITFDYDGTIGQTFERQFGWFKYWAKLNSKSLPFKNVRDFLGFYNEHCAKKGGVQNVYDSLSLPCDMNDKQHPVWQAYLNFKKDNNVSLYPGMRQVIEEVWQRGHLSNNSRRTRRLRMAINTTNTWDSVYRDLQREGVLHCFDSFVTSEVLSDYHGAEGGNHLTKPSKISLAMVLGLIDSEGEFTIHIGDTLNDLVASHKVIRLNPSRPETLITVGASWGYEGRAKLEQGVKLNDKSGATVHFNYIIDRPEEFTPLVEKYLAS